MNFSKSSHYRVNFFFQEIEVVVPSVNEQLWPNEIIALPFYQGKGEIVKETYVRRQYKIMISDTTS